MQHNGHADDQREEERQGEEHGISLGLAQECQAEDQRGGEADPAAQQCLAARPQADPARREDSESKDRQEQKEVETTPPGEQSPGEEQAQRKGRKPSVSNGRKNARGGVSGRCTSATRPSDMVSRRKRS